MKDLLLGIDVGTTAVKAVVFGVDGTVISVGQSEYTTYFFQPGWVEQDPDDWWQSTCIAVQQAIQSVPDASDRVVGISVSSQAPTLLPVDDSGRPLRRGLIWMDRRAEIESQEIAGRFGFARVHELTGNRPDPYFVASKILWYRKHEPHLFEKTRYFLQINGYINFRLTGHYSLDEAHAGLLQVFNPQNHQWATEICDFCSISPDFFPTIKPSHAVCGELTNTAAQEIGLSAGIPVVVGTVDGAAAALEAGVVEPGIAAEMTGTSTVLMVPNATGLTEISLIAMPHALSGLHLLLGAQVASGASLRWYRDQFGTQEVGIAQQRGSYDVLTDLAGQVPVGSEGVMFLPYMMGERSPIWHTNARGVFFGLSLATSRDAFIRAILEGVAFALRHNVEVARNAGAEFSQIRCVGGGSRSSLWNQIKADVLGIPIAIPETSVGAPFGNAIVAGVGTGIYDDGAQAIKRFVSVRETYEPNTANHHIYSERFHLFRTLYENLRSTFDLAASMSPLPGRDG